MQTFIHIYIYVQAIALRGRGGKYFPRLLVTGPNQKFIQLM